MTRVVYPHPLDYTAGMKYSLTRLKVDYEYKPGPENFAVREVVDHALISRSAEQAGRDSYIVIRVVKKGVDTLEALRVLSRRLGLPPENIYFHGLKDKNATTTSYFYVRRLLIDEKILPFEEGNVSFRVEGYLEAKPKGLLKGNEFEVTLKDVKNSLPEAIKKIMYLIERHGLPAYYGYQRFGARRHNTHILGKLIITGREDLFATWLLKAIYPLEDLDATVRRLEGSYRNLYYESLYTGSRYSSLGLKRFARSLHGLAVDAYASYLFNLLLNSIIERRGYLKLDNSYPMPGCSSAVELYREILRIEGVSVEKIRLLPCFYRKGMFKPLNTELTCNGGVCRLKFTLEPGQYATVVLRELFKDNLVLS